MTLFEWREYSYFPYELTFARLELERVIGAQTTELENGLAVHGADIPVHLAERLTYFGRIVHSDGAVTIPHQTKLEMGAANGTRARQATRYSAHGLHEYKGKFNPQVVRAIGNILGVEEGDRVLDPFCGSGTTLLECAHAGWNGVGIDRNPLAVKIANAKVRALELARGGSLEAVAAEVCAGLKEPAGHLSGYEARPEEELAGVLGDGWLEELPSVEYLRSWFPVSVLAQAVAAFRVFRSRVSDSRDRAIFEVMLSDQLRGASLQEPADLRIRRRKNPSPNYPLLDELVSAITSTIPRIMEAGATTPAFRTSQAVYEGDIQSSDVLRQAGFGSSSFDAMITSPPYETALPYIDTQRLSLVILGLLEAGDIMKTERQLIGARELSGSERQELERSIRREDKALPDSVYSLCATLLDAAEGPENGFRRKNRPALTFRYFLGMASSFRTVLGGLRPGAPVALVVGTNRTRLGGTEFVIDTPGLLIDVAEAQGFRFVEVQSMDTYPRYDLHQQNSIDAETLIILRR